jgi:hypothetical protein
MNTALQWSLPECVISAIKILGKIIMENRRDIRWNLLLFLPVHHKSTGEFLGYIADIAEHGVLLFSANHIEMGVAFEMEIRHNDLADAMLNNNIPEHLNFKVRSRWVDVDVKPSFHRTGFMFEELSQEQHKAIHQLIRNVARNLG